MKQYHIRNELTKPSSSDDSWITIHNDDKNPIITEISCGSFYSGGERYRSVRIQIKNETPEMSAKFFALPATCKTLARGCEAIMQARNNMDDIVAFFEVIQQIDPLPRAAFLEIAERMKGYDLTVFTPHELIKQAVLQNNHQEALQLAIEKDTMGDSEALMLLASLYEQNQDIAHHIIVLESFPQTHPSFAAANETLHDKLHEVSIPAEKSQEFYHLLERKLRAALNAGNSLASNYFDELCGNSGTMPNISDVKGDPDTLIKIACSIREMQRTIKELKEQQRERVAEDTDKEPSSRAQRFL